MDSLSVRVRCLNRNARGYDDVALAAPLLRESVAPSACRRRSRRRSRTTTITDHPRRSITPTAAGGRGIGPSEGIHLRHHMAPSRVKSNSEPGLFQSRFSIYLWYHISKGSTHTAPKCT